MSSVSKHQTKRANQPAAVAVPQIPTPVAVPEVATSAAQAAATIPTPAPQLLSAMIEVPLATPPDRGYMSLTSSACHVDAQLRDQQDREALMQMRAGLDAMGARTRDGRRVVSYADTIRWLIQEVGKRLEEAKSQNPGTDEA